MYRYHPRKAPDPDLWLAMDEQERIQLVEAFHRVDGVKLPSIKAHAVFHAIVENQIAGGLKLKALYAHNMLAKGMPKEVLQTFLGHRLTRTTEIYANWVKSDDLLKWAQ